MAITFVNSAVGINNSGSALTPLNSATFVATAGNFLVVGIRQNTDNNPPTSVTDTAGNKFVHYPQFDSSQATVTQNLLSIWIAINILGNASNKVTVGWAAGHDFSSVIVRQYSPGSGVLQVGEGTTKIGTATPVTSSAFNADGITAFSAVIIMFASSALATQTFSAGLIAGSTATNLVVDAAAAAQLQGSEDLIVSSKQAAVTANIGVTGVNGHWELSVVVISVSSAPMMDWTPVEDAQRNVDVIAAQYYPPEEMLFAPVYPIINTTPAGILWDLEGDVPANRWTDWTQNQSPEELLFAPVFPTIPTKPALLWDLTDNEVASLWRDLAAQRSDEDTAAPQTYFQMDFSGDDQAHGCDVRAAVDEDSFATQTFFQMDFSGDDQARYCEVRVAVDEDQFAPQTFFQMDFSGDDQPRNCDVRIVADEDQPASQTFFEMDFSGDDQQMTLPLNLGYAEDEGNQKWPIVAAIAPTTGYDQDGTGYDRFIDYNVVIDLDDERFVIWPIPAPAPPPVSPCAGFQLNFSMRLILNAVYLARANGIRVSKAAIISSIYFKKVNAANFKYSNLSAQIHDINGLSADWDALDACGWIGGIEPGTVGAGTGRGPGT